MRFISANHPPRRLVACCSAMLLALASGFSVLSDAQAQKSPLSGDSLEDGFRTPPPAARPWVFWMWLRVQTNHAAITADLEAMHATGIEGAIIYDSGVGGGMEADSRMVVSGKGYERVRTDDYKGAHFTPIPFPPMVTWKPESRELLRFASKEAGRLGIKLVISVGLASTSGDIAPEYGQQRLLWSETAVTGPLNFNDRLPDPTTIVHPARTGLKVLVQGDPPVDPRKKNYTDIAILAVPEKPEFSPSEVLRVAAAPDADGVLQWAVPPGKWRLLRFAYAPTGRTNAWGLFTDAMSKEALDATWKVTLGQVLLEMKPEERRGLYGIEDDSWEAGESTWTRLFVPQFRDLRGYDLVPWLPVLAGKPMGTPAERQGIERDFDRTIADLIARNHYAHLSDLAHRNHLVSYSEAAGPNSGQLDPLQNSSSIDVPMGEFWMPSQHRPTLDRRFIARDSASASHVYGRPINGCESFTSVGPFWEETFFDMKRAADQAFSDGCNHIVIHNFSQSPSVTAKPGYVYFAGTLYGRNTTWWDQTPAFNAYLGRNDFMLQQGHFVADALIYRGDAIGQIEQRKTLPALPAPGYDHDNANLDVLVHRLRVLGGRLLLPDGMSYRMLVLPDASPMRIEALRKIRDLVNAGAIVVGPRPGGMAGLPHSAAESQEFDALATRLWPPIPSASQGHVWTMTPPEALRTLNLAPDFQFAGQSPAGELDWIHRRQGKTDLYLVSSRWDTPESILATFRVSGMQPELWDPVTGDIREAHAFHQHDGLTSVPLQFDPRGSVFLVFRKPIAPNADGRVASNYPSFTRTQELSGPWHVSFDPRWGGPANITFNALVDWTTRPEEGIRHYSGTAVYRQTFDLRTTPNKSDRFVLNLGEVHEVASVRLNGVDLGVSWTLPARVEITRALHAGSNDLEIFVVNLWPNRLIGDEAVPEAQRFTVTNAHKFNASTPLLASGLIGPVTVQRVVP